MRYGQFNIYISDDNQFIVIEDLCGHDMVSQGVYIPIEMSENISGAINKLYKEAGSPSFYEDTDDIDFENDDITIQLKMPSGETSPGKIHIKNSKEQENA